MTTATTQSLPRRITVIHVGPHVDTLGGTQSVIRAVRDNVIGADSVSVLASWNGPNQLRSLVMTADAAAQILTVRSRPVIHLHISTGGAWLREGLLARVARLRRLPIVVTVHGHDFPEFAAARPRLVGGTLRLAGHVICLNEDAHEAVTALAPSTPVTMIANPVTLDDGAPPVESTPPVVLFAGTIARRKGVDTLVEAWRLLLADGVVGECRIVGHIDDYDPPTVDRLTVEAAMHPEAIPELLRHVRVVVLPSLAEGMPMILTEALAAARPFVATPVGGTATITPDSEMLVPVGDAPALAAALRRYLDDAAYAGEAGRRGREHIRATRSPKVVGEQLRRIYEAL